MKLSYRCCTIKCTEFVLVQLEDPNTKTRTISSASHLFEQLQEHTAPPRTTHDELSFLRDHGHTLGRLRWVLLLSYQRELSVVVIFFVVVCYIE